MSLPVDNEVHELKLGNSFDSNPKTGFHSIRYDFKPASVDTGKEACVEVGSGNQVTVTVPHVEGSGISQTVFRGNKQPLVKECVLIIDHDTGTFTLEKLTSKVMLKKTRLEGSSKAMQHLSGRITPVDSRKSGVSHSQKMKSSHRNSPDGDGYSITPIHSDGSKGGDDIALVGEISESSDDDEPSSSSISYKSNSQMSSSQINKFGVLDNDLALSESGSDSD